MYLTTVFLKVIEKLLVYQSQKNRENVVAEDPTLNFYNKRK